MGRRSSTLCTFSKASRTSNSPFGLLALEKEKLNMESQWLNTCSISGNPSSFNLISHSGISYWKLFNYFFAENQFLHICSPILQKAISSYISSAYFFQFQTSTSNFAVGHSKALNSVCMSARGQGVVDEERWKNRVNGRNTLLKIYASV